MTQARKTLVCISDTPYYHITSRCVRRAFLCGEDHYSGKSYEHRRQWVVDRIRLLSSLFAIDICAYAVMSNHYHIVVKLCPEQLGGISNDEVIARWCRLFKGPQLIQRYLAGDHLTKAELGAIKDIVSVWRTRLADLSWFMRCLNQHIAYQANQEDQCRGRFWEARYTSQALMTEEALLSCMAYVDLNPIRAKLATTPELSDYTSIQERTRPIFNLSNAVKAQVRRGELYDTDLPIELKPLLHFDSVISEKNPQTGIPFSFDDYLALVDWTGRAIREDKRGFIDNNLPSILERMDIPIKHWLINTTQFEHIHRYTLSRRQSKPQLAA